MTRFVVCFFILLLAFGGCKKSPDSGSTSPEKPNASPAGTEVALPKLDACALLTKEEIEAVQGSPITDTKSSENAEGAFRVSQCYFAAAQSDKSVSFTVTQAKVRGKGRTPRDYWNETFGSYRDGKKENEREEKEKEAERGRGEREREETSPPQKISGVGEEAFWTGNRFGGALYVLKKENFIRVSVGGPANQETKIENSKTLAEKALARLP